MALAPRVAPVPPQRVPASLDPGETLVVRGELWGALDELVETVPAGEPDMNADVDPSASPMPRPTVCLSKANGAVPTRVRVSAPGIALVCSVPPSGLSVGRDAENDVSVGSMTVSRRHLCLVATEAGIVVQNLGATNPPLLNGRPLVGEARVLLGDVLELRGADVTIRPCPPA